MAAITTRLDRGTLPPPSCEIALGQAEPALCEDELRKRHSLLTEFLWNRRALEGALAEPGRTLTIAERDTHTCKAGVYFVLTPGLPPDVLPWSGKYGETTPRKTWINLFGRTSKMACPSFDLPSGAPVFGGSCPAAAKAQTVSALSLGHDRLPDGARIDLARSVCSVCYATTGSYKNISVQIGNVVRYAWARKCMESPAGREEFVRTVVRGLELLARRPRDCNPREAKYAPWAIETCEGRKHRFVRVHSSGDLFSYEYLDAWREITRRVPEAVFWSPTRAWAHSHAWARRLREGNPPNLIVRESAYHTGDAAPPGGTTTVWEEDLEPRGRYDWNCPVYEVVTKGMRTCLTVAGPNGRRPCRVCWLRPGLRVNYTLHLEGGSGAREDE